MRLGIDLGGTKIEALALDEDGQEHGRLRVPTPHDYAATIEAIAGLLGEVERLAGPVRAVGLGIPGTVSPATGLVKNANSTWLIGHPLDQDLERRLGRPVRVANDANCFALSEAMDGAAAPAADPPGRPVIDMPRVVFAVIVGTGTGGGVVVDGKVLVGRDSIAGEWGHNPLPWMTPEEAPGQACYCGQRGCIETFLSGPALARDHLAVTGEELDGPNIVARAEAGEERAQATLARYEDRMARALTSVINLLDPEVIVLGGGLSKVARLYQNVPRLWGRHVFSDTVSTRLVPPRHGDASGVRGAAWLWPRLAGK